MQTTIVDEQTASTGKHLPKDVLTLEFNPTRKLAHFVIELSNVPGTLEHSAALATQHKVNILSGFHHTSSASERGFWSFFADFTAANITPEQLSEELKSLSSVLNVRFQVPTNGLLVDAFHFPLRWGGQRAIMLRTDSMGAILSRINGMFGDGPAAKVVLYEMGEAAGRAIYKELAARIGRDMIRDELSQVLALYASSGWGLAELFHIDYNMRTALVRIRENFECAHYNGKSSMPRSSFVRGHLAGWFTELFRIRVDITENRCIAKGDEYCDFAVEAGTV